MCGVEKAWSLWHLSQTVAKAISMAEPYLPFSGCGLDSDPAWIRAMLHYRFATETAGTERNVQLLRNHILSPLEHQPLYKPTIYALPAILGVLLFCLAVEFKRK
jgi:hypothetical protein